MAQSTVSKSVMTSVKLDAHEKNQLCALADFKKRTPHYLMREAIRNYIEKETARHAFITEARDSYEAYQQTGLHITHEEFDSWIQSLAQKKNNLMPICHK